MFLSEKKTWKSENRAEKNNGRGPEKFRLLDGFFSYAIIRFGTAEMSRISVTHRHILCTPTLSMTAIFMLTVLSQKQPERFNVRFLKLLAT